MDPRGPSVCEKSGFVPDVPTDPQKRRALFVLLLFVKEDKHEGSKHNLGEYKELKENKENKENKKNEEERQ